jgi:hypothetical protein
MPSSFAIETFDIPLRRIFQNPNCFSFVGRNICKSIDIYNIKTLRTADRFFPAGEKRERNGLPADGST